MDRRDTRKAIAANVREAIVFRDANPISVASAADMRPSAFMACLNSEAPFMAVELARVGGFLRVPMNWLTKGATA